MRPVWPWPYHILAQPSFFLIRGQRARRFVLVRYWIGKYVRTHVVRSEGFGDHIAFPSWSFGKSAPVNRSFQVTIWVLMAPNSISEHANFKIFRGGGACPQTPLDKCALHTNHPEPEIVAS